MLYVPYKVLERLIYTRKNPIIDTLFSREQAGLPRGKSIVDQATLLGYRRQFYGKTKGWFCIFQSDRSI